MFKCRKQGKTRGRRSANEAMIEDFMNNTDAKLIKGYVYVKENVVLYRIKENARTNI